MTNEALHVNTYDITSTSDRVLDAFMALKSNDTSFNFDGLSRLELVELQGLAGNKVDLSGWITLQGLKEEREHAARKVSVGRDYEGAILRRQEREDNF
jgi:hypothetical protein